MPATMTGSGSRNGPESKPIDLKWSLVRHVLLAALVGYGLVIVVLAARTESVVRRADAAVADALARHIEVRLLPFAPGARSAAPLPDWDGIVSTALGPGQCARYIDPRGASFGSVCVGSGPASEEPPLWFQHAASGLLGDLPANEHPIVSGGAALGKVVTNTLPAAVSRQLWRDLGQLGFLTAILAGVMSLLVYAAIDRALRPAGAVLQGLNRVAEGDLTARLPGFGLVELQRISDVFNEMAVRLEQTTTERAALATRLVDAEEETRRHIARELHDDLAQRLSALSAMAGTVAVAAGGDRPDIAAEARILTSAVSDTMRTLRATLSGLRPIELDDLGLAASLEGLVEDCKRRSAGALSIALTIEAPLEQLSSTAAGHVYRIVQEGLTNVMRHAGARTVAIELRARSSDRPGSRQQLVLTVEDDGDAQGDPATPSAGLGLIGIRERALALGGRSELRLMPGRGHILTVVIPIELERSGS